VKTLISFKEVEKTYANGIKALDKVNFDIEDGEFVFIVGASGAGKSTIIKLLMAEERDFTGEIQIDRYKMSRIKKREIPYLRRRIGVVYQDFRLIQNKTVYENVAFAMRVIGIAPLKIKKRVPYILNLVGLQDKANRYPNELSGGEQQRVALARAFVNNPKIIIADEPTGNIDPALSMEIMKLLSAINEFGITIVIVTHEKELVDMFSKRVITIEGGHVVGDKTGGYDADEQAEQSQ